MIPVSSGIRVWLAVGHTDMRRGMGGLALQVQQALGRDPHAGDLHVFRDARGDMIKNLWRHGIGKSLYAKRLEKAGGVARGYVRSRSWRGPCRPHHTMESSCRAVSVSAKLGMRKEGATLRPVSTETCGALPCRCATTTARMTS